MKIQINSTKSSHLLGIVNKVFIYILLAYLPVSELFIHALESYTTWPDNLVFWVSHFYEPLLVLLLIVNLLVFVLGKKAKLHFMDFAAGIFILYALISIAFHYHDWQRGLESLRFLILPFVAYIFVRFTNYADGKKISSTYLAIAGAIATVGVVEYFFLPANWIGNFLGIAGFGFGQNALASTNQASSFLAGPNQLASYLIFPYFYALHRAFNSNKSFLAQWSNYLLLPLTLGILLTFSRSAILGMLLGTLLIIIFNIRSNRPKVSYVVLFLVSCAALVFSYVMYGGGTLTDLLTHGASTAQHASATEGAMSQLLHSGFLNLVFGTGVGTAGPAALKFGGIISENYYLQILIEVGIVGFIIFAAFFVGAIKTFFHWSRILFFAIIALLVNALFLHIFSDNPAMAVSIFIIIAVIINVETFEENSKSEILNTKQIQITKSSNVGKLEF